MNILLSLRQMARRVENSGRAAGAPQGSGEPRKVRLIFILGALSAFAPLSIDMYLPALPTLTRDFGSSATEVQLTLSACLIGMALGQATAGPLSDALGRLRPLLVGLVAYTLASLFCVFAPSIWALITLRFIQGFAGAAGIVIARAVARDMYGGLELARFFSLLMLVMGLAPILAPVLGGILLEYTSWRGVFVVLTLIGTLLVFAVAGGLKETLPSESRQSGGLRTTIATFRRLLSDRAFVGYALSCGLAISAMFSYISGSPFVLQNIYGVSPQTFSLIFGMNALGIVIVGQVNGWLVGRVSAERLLGIGLIASSLGGVSFLLVTLSGGIGLIGVLPSLFLLVASLGFVMPNATTLALSGHPNRAGSASALLGLLQYVIGATAAPLVGIAGDRTAIPMALVIATLSIAALLVFALLARPSGGAKS